MNTTLARFTLAAIAWVAIGHAGGAAPVKPHRVSYPRPGLPPVPQLLGSSPESLPPGPGGAIATSKCLFCHQSEMLTQQRLKPAQWIKEVDKMIKWGAPVTSQERPGLEAYLAKHFGPLRAPEAPRKGLLVAPSARYGLGRLK